MKTVVICLVVIACSCADAFIAPTSSFRPQRAAAVAASVSTRSGMSMKLIEDDFIPSEEWLGQYMGEQGLRYALNKTPDEVEQEGDYTLLEKLFGQTSNNKARMDLKAKVLAKADIPTDPERYKSWTAKYGYGRFFPVYVDKSGNGDEAPAPAATKAATPKKVTASAVAAKPAAALKAKTGLSVANFVSAAKAVAKTEAPKPAPKKPAPKKVAAAPAKSLGNIKNIPKAL